LTGGEPADVLASVSTIESSGKHLTHIRGARRPWLRQSIRDCARFRSENVPDAGDSPPAH
jgi:hypothetical protein